MSKLTNLLDITAAAAKIGCTTGYVRYLLRCNRLQGQKVGQRAWLVEVKSVERFCREPKTTGRPRKVTL
jgi:hypothetical protein